MAELACPSRKAQESRQRLPLCYRFTRPVFQLIGECQAVSHGLHCIQSGPLSRTALRERLTGSPERSVDSCSMITDRHTCAIIQKDGVPCYINLRTMSTSRPSRQRHGYLQSKFKYPLSLSLSNVLFYFHINFRFVWIVSISDFQPRDEPGQQVSLRNSQNATWSLIFSALPVAGFG